MDIEPIVIKEKFKGNQIENRSKLVPYGVLRCGIIGTSGAGKTTFLTQYFIPMCHPFYGGIIVVCKNEEQPQYKAIEDYAKKQKIPFQLVTEFGKDEFEQFRVGDLPRCLIWDDIMDTDDLRPLIAVAKFGRVRHIYMAVLSQDMKSIPQQIRVNLNMYALFPLAAPHVQRAVITGMSAFVDGEQLKKAYHYITRPQNRYSLIIINLTSPYNVIVTRDGTLYDINSFRPVILKKEEKKK